MWHASSISKHRRLKIDILKIDILNIDILKIDILKIDILNIGILNIDILNNRRHGINLAVQLPCCEAH